MKTPEYKEMMRAKAMERIANGTHTGWKTRSKVEPSYAEKYFISVFENEGIEYKREVTCGKYFIDFVVGNLAIEVDGKQHNYPERKASDALKEEVIKEAGFEIVRIKWVNPVGKKKEILHEQVKHLLEKIKKLNTCI